MRIAGMSRIAYAVAGALALALLAPTAAHADRWSVTDEAGDVEGWHYSPEPEPCGTDTVVDGAEQANEDITRLGVRHTRRSVIITTRFRELDPGLEQLVPMYVRTNLGGWWLDVIRFESRPGKWRTFTFLGEEPDYPDPDDFDECGGAGIIIADEACRMPREVDFDRDRVRLVVPRTCLGNPRWARVGAEAHRFVEPEDPEAEDFTVFSDEWDGGTTLSEWDVSYGPRVRATRGAQIGGVRATTLTTDKHRFVVRRDGLFARR